jgi:hypothetical protein
MSHRGEKGGSFVTYRETGRHMQNIIRLGSRDSSVGIATSYGLDDRGVGVRVPVGSIIFPTPNRPDRL